MRSTAAVNQCGIIRKLTIAGAAQGPLSGTTFVAKDLFDVEGYVTGCGNPDWQRTHEPATQTAPALTKMLSAGCTLLGKTNMDELAYGMDGVNVHYGTPLNSQFIDREPGGSSSGSASAVAGEVVDFALGSDTAGSVRVPACYCGVFGFRPTHGRVPIEGVVPLAPSLDTVGWFARTASGLKTCGSVLLEQATADSGFCTGVGTILLAQDAFDACSDDIKPALSGALRALDQCGYKILEISLSSMGWENYVTAFRLVQGFECWQAHGQWITEVKPNFADAVRKRFELASTVTEEQFEEASQFRQQMREQFGKLLCAPRTLLCLPTAPALPPLLIATADEIERNRASTMKMSVIAPLLGMPQVSVPVKLTETTFTGMSFMAAAAGDEMLLDWAVELSKLKRFAR